MNREDLELSATPDYESGRLFDEWWASVPRERMMQWGDEGVIQQKFDEWRSQRETKQ
jgi:hypothetical protein